MKKALECIVLCSLILIAARATAMTSIFDCRGLLQDPAALGEVLSSPTDEVELLIKYLAAITHEVEGIEAAPSRLNLALAEPQARAKFALVNYVRAQFADALNRFAQNKDLAADPKLDRDLRGLVEDERQGLIQELQSHRDEIFGLIDQVIHPQIDGAVIVEIRPAAGLSAEPKALNQLSKMYLNLSRKQLWRAEILDSTDTSIILRISGGMAQRWMDGESGVHRIITAGGSVATKDKHKTHTNYQQVIVYAEPTRQQFQLNLADITFEASRGAGSGGEHVHTPDSTIRATHRPTGLEVWMSSRRSQNRNKELAIEILRAKLFERQLAAEHAAVNRARSGRDAQAPAKERYVRTYDARTNRAEHDAILQGGLKPIFEVRQRRELLREMKLRLLRD